MKYYKISYNNNKKEDSFIVTIWTTVQFAITDNVLKLKYYFILFINKTKRDREKKIRYNREIYIAIKKKAIVGSLN